MTPAESERLRQVSYHKQLAAGTGKPGHGDLVVNRFRDDAKWSPHVGTEFGNDNHVTPGDSSDEEARK